MKFFKEANTTKYDSKDHKNSQNKFMNFEWTPVRHKQNYLILFNYKHEPCGTSTKVRKSP